MVEGDTARGGRYVTQLGGHRAFVPHPLPRDPSIALDDDLQDLLSRADRALGRLDGAIQTLPNPDLFVAMYVRKEAVLSSQIEGTQSSLRDVLAAEAQLHLQDLPNDVNEVVNYIRAMNHGLERLQTLPVSVRLVRETHEILMRGVRGGLAAPGELRRSQNWIGPPGCTLAEAVFVPPPPQDVPRALSDLERFLHAEGPPPLLIRIGLAHAQFETIHPFLDGNGRLGRLLVTFLSCERSVLTKPVLYLSHYFHRHRQSYYEHLQAVRDDGAWEAWLGFFLRGVLEVARQATHTARNVLELRERDRQRITDHLGRAAGNGHRTLEALFLKPIVSVGDVQEVIGTSYPAANNLVEQLVQHGILREITGRKRHRRFQYEEYVALFHDTERGPAEGESGDGTTTRT